MNAVTDIADQDAELLDEGIGRIEARVRGVARAGEVGLVLLEVVEALALKAARLVTEQAEDEGLDLKVVAAVGDLAQAYGKVSRSIRQNALLEDRLETLRRDRAAGLEDARRARALKRAEAQAAKSAVDEKAEFQRVHGPRLAREAAVSDVMQQLSFAQREDPEEAEALDIEVAELLEEGADYEAYGERPVSETVARLCKALELSADWEDFAREDWAKEEARAGVIGSPYVSIERGGSGECVLAVRGLQGAGLAATLATEPRETGPP